MKKKKYHVDSNIKRNQNGPQGGQAIPGHPRQCQGTTRKGIQCGRWAIVGSQYCQFHGGRQPLIRRRMATNYYSRRAGKRLAEKFAELEANSEERMSLSSEIDTARILAERAVRTYEKVVIDDSLKNSPDAERLKANAAIVLRDALNHVASMVQSMAKIEAMCGSKVSIQNIKWVCERITKCIDSSTDDQKLKTEIFKKIEGLRLIDEAIENKVTITID